MIGWLFELLGQLAAVKAVMEARTAQGTLARAVALAKLPFTLPRIHGVCQAQCGFEAALPALDQVVVLMPASPVREDVPSMSSNSCSTSRRSNDNGSAP